MEFILKGITNNQLLEGLKLSSVSQYTFDLRPKSFNFTQAYNIKNLITNNPQSTRYSLWFENEKDFIITELYNDIKSSLKEQDQLLLEFSGETSLADLEKFELPYIWHYHAGEKIKNISFCKNLKRIVFHHADLEEYHRGGELHGFFNLFSDYTNKIYFEIQANWDSQIILSIFDFFTIPMLSFEINSQVELSYQNPDVELIKQHLLNLENLFENKE